MADVLFPRFLDEPLQYRDAERYWQGVWSRIEPTDREHTGWLIPWLNTGSLEIRDGNPIFSAWSPSLGRGIRVRLKVDSGVMGRWVAGCGRIGGLGRP